MAAKKFGWLAVMLLMGFLSIPAMGQAGGGGGGGGGGGFGGGGGGGGGGGRRGGGMTPAQQQANRLTALQTQLGATDDEFAALTPKIVAVMNAQTAAGVNQFGGRGGGRRGGGGGGGGAAAAPAGPQSPVALARAELQAAIDDQNSTADLIKGKLDAFRAAVVKAKQDLVAAQADLKSVLTQRQEAIMVLGNYLD